VRLIPEITYMKTRDARPTTSTTTASTYRSSGRAAAAIATAASAVLVDSIRVPNPYAIALLYDYVRGKYLRQMWYTVLANNKLLIQIGSFRKTRHHH
jgi:hypothetical protein